MNILILLSNRQILINRMKNPSTSEESKAEIQRIIDDINSQLGGKYGY